MVSLSSVVPTAHPAAVVATPVKTRFCRLRYMSRERKEVCDCVNLERMANDPKCPVTFDQRLNEYHINGENGTYWLIYYCPFCGGKMPESQRNRFFHIITDDERTRLCELTKDLRTVQDVKSAFGNPEDQRKVVTTVPERDGKPEIVMSRPLMIYTKLSEIADVHVIVSPDDRVDIRFHSKSIKNL
jgi:hypothetical protein